MKQIRFFISLGSVFSFFFFFCIVCMEDDDCVFEDLIGLFVSGIGFSFSIFLFFIRLCLIFSC
jgi:hypothetical protein